jgi:hypothetical protein
MTLLLSVLRPPAQIVAHRLHGIRVAGHARRRPLLRCHNDIS